MANHEVPPIGDFDIGQIVANAIDENTPIDVELDDLANSFDFSLLLADEDKTFNVLDKKTSLEVIEAMNKNDSGYNDDVCRCSHCQDVFSSTEFDIHICTHDENQKLIEKVVDNSAKIAFQGFQLAVIKMIDQNQKLLIEMQHKKGKGKAKGKAHSLECFKCNRQISNESRMICHYENHIGELIDLSPLEKPWIQQNVMLCMICGEVFDKEAKSWDHLKANHMEIVDDVTYWMVPNDVFVSQELHEEKVQAMKKRKLNSGEAQVSKEEMPTTKNGDSTRSGVVMSTREFPGQEFLKTISVTKIFQCEFCDAIFSNPKLMLHHASTHPASTGYRCNTCELKGLSLTEILVHRHKECVIFRDIRNHLKDFPRVWFCNVCDEEFHGLEQLQTHRIAKLHLFPRMSLLALALHFDCALCLKSYATASEIANHYAGKHRKQPQILAEGVPKTSERIPKTEQLNRGGVHQVSTLSRQYLCEVCGKSYTQSSHLWQHLRFHQGVKPFACTFEGCDRRFTIRPDLKDHVRKFHTGERPYLCTVCNKRFLTGSVYYQHRLIHLGERRYGCDECQRRFYRADALRNHLRIHTGEKPFTCGAIGCGLKFRQRGDRDKHMKARHKGEEVIITSPKKAHAKSFGNGRVRNNESLYKSSPGKDKPM